MKLVWRVLDLFWPRLIRLKTYQNDGYFTTLLVFAFGRNTYEDRELNRVIQIRDKAGNNEYALLRLTHLKVDPGDSNRAIARMMMDIIEEKIRNGKPKPKRVVLQWEVALATLRIDEHWFFNAERQGITTVCLWPRLVLTRFPWKHTIGYDTIAVAQDAKPYCDGEAVGKDIRPGIVTVLCHRRHLARAAKTASLVLQKPVYLAARKNEYPDIYDPNSVQKQCQAPSSFALMREIVARMRLLAKANKLAKSL